MATTSTMAAGNSCRPHGAGTVAPTVAVCTLDDREGRPALELTQHRALSASGRWAPTQPTWPRDGQRHVMTYVPSVVAAMDITPAATGKNSCRQAEKIVDVDHPSEQSLTDSSERRRGFAISLGPEKGSRKRFNARSTGPPVASPSSTRSVLGEDPEDKMTDSAPFPTKADRARSASFCLIPTRAFSSSNASVGPGSENRVRTQTKLGFPLRAPLPWTEP